MIEPGRRSGPGLLRAAFAFVFLVLLSACAEIAPPPGGPLDLVAPTIVSATPESLAVNVDPAAPFVVTFSEKVAKDLLPDWVFVRPFRRIDDINWNGAVASITFRDGFPPDSTVSIEIGDGIADRHANRMLRPFRRTYATGSVLNPGVLSGDVRRSRSAAAPTLNVGTTRTSGPPSRTAPGAAIFVWAYRAGVGDTIPDLAHADPDYVTEVGPDGTYRLDGLPVGLPLRVYGVYDADRSRTFSNERDFASALPDTLILTVSSPRVAKTIFLIDPKAPGTISGRIALPADTTVVDTLSYGVILSAYPENADSAATAWPPVRTVKQDRAAKNGTFLVRSVPPGRYRIGAFTDLDRNGGWSRLEPLGAPVEVLVRPDEETANLNVPRPPG